MIIFLPIVAVITTVLFYNEACIDAVLNYDIVNFLIFVYDHLCILYISILSLSIYCSGFRPFIPLIVSDDNYDDVCDKWRIDRHVICYGALLMPSTNTNNKDIVYEYKLKAVRYEGEVKVEIGVSADNHDHIPVLKRRNVITDVSWLRECKDMEDTIISIIYLPNKAKIEYQRDDGLLRSWGYIYADSNINYRLFVKFYVKTTGCVQLQLL